MASFIKSRLGDACRSSLLLHFVHESPVSSVRVGEPELYCNHRGIEFIEAYVDVKLFNLHLHDPRASLKAKLVASPSMEGAV